MRLILTITLFTLFVLSFTACKEDFENQYPPKSRFTKLVKRLMIEYSNTKIDVYRYEYDELGRMSKMTKGVEEPIIYEYQSDLIIATRSNKIIEKHNLTNNRITKSYLYGESGWTNNPSTNSYNSENQLIQRKTNDKTTNYCWSKNALKSYTSIKYGSKDEYKYTYTSFPNKVNIDGVSVNMTIGHEGFVSKCLPNEINVDQQTIRYYYDLDNDGCPVKITQKFFNTIMGESTASIITASISYE